MDNDNELETELETELGEAGEADTQADDQQESASANGSLSESSEGGESGDSEANDSGPKSLAEALSAGVDSVTKKGEKKPDGAAKDDKGSETGADKKDAKDQNATDSKQKQGQDDGKDGKGKPDHVNDPIDSRLAPRTQERIRSLVDTVKTKDAELAEYKQIAENNGAMIGAIMDTGATPEEFGAMVGYLGAVHSDDPAKLEAAYTLLQSELQGLALRMGKPIPEVDWLSGHQDLVDAVRSGATTRELAIEIAMNRAGTKRTQAQATAKANKTKADGDAAAATERDTQTAISELDALGTELAANDPQYEAKYKAIVPKLQAEFKTLAPSQWKTRFLQVYATTKIAAPVAAVAPKINPPKGQPLRPSTPSGGQQKAPGSALDALSSAIDGMRN